MLTLAVNVSLSASNITMYCTAGILYLLAANIISMFKLFVDLSNVRSNVILAGKCIPLYQCQPFQFVSTVFFKHMLLLQLSNLCLPPDVRVKAKVWELTQTGVPCIAEFRRHLSSYVRMEFFAGCDPPPMKDARFWPSSQTLLIMMHRVTTALQ